MSKLIKEETIVGINWDRCDLDTTHYFVVDDMEWEIIEHRDGTPNYSYKLICDGRDDPIYAMDHFTLQHRPDATLEGLREAEHGTLYERPKKPFTKSDLVPGLHVVECRNGSLFIYTANDTFISIHSDGGPGLFIPLSDYTDELVQPRRGLDKFDIMAVYDVGFGGVMSSRANLSKIFQR